MNTYHITQQRLGNPGPLGLSCFGLTTLLLNMKNAQWLGGSSMAMILGMGAVFGGFGQLVAGVQEFVRGNTFAATAFAGYGCFWMSFVLMSLPSFVNMKQVADGHASYFFATGADADSKAAYLFVWGIFTFCMFIGTVQKRKPLCLQGVFGSLVVLFFLLGGSDIAEAKGEHEASEKILKAAGYVGMFCGGLAMYTAQGECHGWWVGEHPLWSSSKQSHSHTNVVEMTQANAASVNPETAALVTELVRIITVLREDTAGARGGAAGRLPQPSGLVGSTSYPSELSVHAGGAGAGAGAPFVHVHGPAPSGTLFSTPPATRPIITTTPPAESPLNP